MEERLTDYRSRDWDKFMLRFPQGMRERVKESAKANRRSMNAEIVFHIERAFSGAKDATGAGLPTSTPAASPNNAVFEHGAHQPG